MKMPGSVAIRLLFAITLALHATLTHASSDVGFIIRSQDFSLILRLGFAEIGENKPSEEHEITGADQLFFTCLQWFTAHHDELRKRDEDVVIYLNMSEKNFGVQVNDDVYIENIGYIPGRAASTLLTNVESILDIQSREYQHLSQLPLFLVRSKKYMETYENTDIYFGSIPGNMYSYSENNYLLMKWFWNTNSELAQHLEDIGATVNQVKLERSLTKKLLVALE